MFYRLSGKLIFSDPSFAVIECGGVAFQCHTTLNTVKQLPSAGEHATLYTYLQVREDALTLYGFFDVAELDCFKLLLTISGVGAKAGISVLSQMTPAGLMGAVASGDVNSIKKAQGIGMKTAQRIVLELKDKMKGLSLPETDGGDVELPSVTDDRLQQAAEALVSLGYGSQEAGRAVSALDPTRPLEELIRDGLKSLARQV